MADGRLESPEMKAQDSYHGLSCGSYFLGTWMNHHLNHQLQWVMVICALAYM